VTLLIRIVFGLVSRFGATTARRVVKPSFVVDRALAKASSAAERARSDDQIDMSDFIAFADQRLADQKLV